MALGSKVDVGGRKATTVPIRQTIQYISEITQDHSYDEIYATLKETNMDPDETAEKLLSQGPFHEVKRKKDKKKENAGHAKSQNHGQHIQQSSSISASEPNIAAYSYQNIRAIARGVLPGITREFRVVRDNRMKENAGCTGSENGHDTFNTSEKRNTERKLHSHGQVALSGSNGGPIKNASLVDTSNKGYEDPVPLGANRREIGVSSSQKSLPSSTIQSARHAGGLHKNYRSTYSSASVPIIPGVSSIRNSFGNQYANKLHQQTVGHRKVVQSKMEWKPKAPQQSRTSICGELDGASSPLSHSTNSTEENVQSFFLAEKQMGNVEFVVIPQHLLVPENEKKHITFGSFGDIDPAISNEEDTVKQFTESASAAAFVETGEGTSVGVQVDSADGMQASCLDSEEPVTSEQLSSESTGLDAHNAVGYSTDGMVRDSSASYGSTPQKHLENSPRLPKLSEAFESQHDYDASFITAAMEDNMGQLGMASQPEVLHSHAKNSGPSNTVAAQLQAFTQQQQVGQLYPQLQLPHFTNFVPYRQLVSPVFVPPMAMPNYSSGAAYAHPPNGSSYLLMPGGSPQIAAAVKYAQSQYKAVPAGSPTGYGNFTNAAGYTISGPGSMGAATGVDDASRVKYKDNNLYVPSAQVETSELWIQNQRDSTQYFNLPPQAPPAYLPSNTPHAQAQLPPIQYSGVYHPQPTATANPHHLVHQQVSPGMSGNIGVNVMAPSPQVGAYQQPPLSHLNWTNF